MKKATTGKKEAEKQMAKIGSLEIRTAGKRKDRVKVVKFPGHDYDIEEFNPTNLTEVARVSPRSAIVRTQNGSFFVRKSSRTEIHGIQHAASEVKLARWLNSLKIKKVKFEEPLAITMGANGRRDVFYRPLFDLPTYRPVYTSEHSKTLENFHRTLERLGITSPDLGNNYLPGQNGVIHVFDFEQWRAPAKLKERLKLRTVPKDLNEMLRRMFKK